MDDNEKQTISLNKYILLIDNRKEQRLIKPSENKYNDPLIIGISNGEKLISNCKI